MTRVRIQVRIQVQSKTRAQAMKTACHCQFSDAADVPLRASRAVRLECWIMSLERVISGLTGAIIQFSVGE
ncbi:MAG TPA: hypothetical protein DCX60_09725 [Phycisphaerales bacterium]|nr:hypothetical protein [Phycisphaerales bacterium]